MPTAVSPQDLEDTELAYNRVKPELDALTVEELAPMNVDLVGAASVALGVAERILSHRERMAKLPEFDVRSVDQLADYAKAAWYAYVTNLPLPEPAEAAQLMEEATALRSKLLMWAVPLVYSGLFEDAAIAKIKEGSGNKDIPSDVVALVALYRSRWDEVKNMCGVTEEDLTRGAVVGPAVFGLVSRRELKASGVSTDGTLRARRAWTLLDRAYGQCRRALAFLRFEEDDFDLVAPNLRRNAGPRAQSTEPPPPAPAPVPEILAQGPNGSSAPTASALGGSGTPFLKS
jgi:hypothetical protein